MVHKAKAMAGMATWNEWAGRRMIKMPLGAMEQGFVKSVHEA